MKCCLCDWPILPHRNWSSHLADCSRTRTWYSRTCDALSRDRPRYRSCCQRACTQIDLEQIIYYRSFQNSLGVRLRTLTFFVDISERIGRTLSAFFDPTLSGIGATGFTVVIWSTVLGRDNVDSTAGTGQNALIDSLISGFANIEWGAGFNAGNCHQCCINLESWLKISVWYRTDRSTYLHIEVLSAVSSLSAKTV